LNIFGNCLFLGSKMELTEGIFKAAKNIFGISESIKNAVKILSEIFFDSN